MKHLPDSKNVNSTMLPLQDSKKFKFTQNTDSALFQGIQLSDKARFMISQGIHFVVFSLRKKELNELIDNLSDLEKSLKDS